jgi:hypothetical protein
MALPRRRMAVREKCMAVVETGLFLGTSKVL